ncbi:hypothetical protein [Sporosarcina sp. BI001-red]|nr:hypothetical protein [Sporosarcina sp. BI001-red]
MKRIIRVESKFKSNEDQVGVAILKQGFALFQQKALFVGEELRKER